MDLFNTWYLTRSAGIVCYLLLTLSVLSGLYSSIRKKRGQTLGVWPGLHLYLGNWGLYTGMFHAGILLFDQYVHLSVKEITVPFWSDYHTISMGLGIVSLYLLIGTILTTELRGKIGMKAWKKLHMISPVAYVLATFHGLLMGTDSTTSGMVALYAGSLFAIAILLGVRLSKRERDWANV